VQHLISLYFSYQQAEYKIMSSNLTLLYNLSDCVEKNVLLDLLINHMIILAPALPSENLTSRHWSSPYITWTVRTSFCIEQV